MSLPQLETFTKLMMLTTSNNDAEALTAIRKANAMLASMNNNWQDFIAGKVRLVSAATSLADDDVAAGVATNFDNEEEIRKLFQRLYDKTSPESSFLDFVDSVHEWWQEKGFLTKSQYEAIRTAYDKTL